MDAEPLPHTMTHTCTGTTHCHVFHIHVGLSLQLGYDLPVEPLKLQEEKREGKEEGLLAVRSRIVRKKTQRVTISSVAVCVGGESHVRGCTYE